ncbi:DUF4261 domain-containing protein [Gordonia neofelifaecis]|uniref:DUF4261 domain-containing protein n=1 Tax=Gordonia neofelifaecis NRRL B-59395 TaxID=644548 RepID=F1YMK6_9ACTN|nr:DUF4261 domain-containing protein [Gordonia neofelifaecis]EGD53941.1 hypothetical protein SCNU_15759 [Gordonia neofelifaecis NRRL B-59395]
MPSLAMLFQSRLDPDLTGERLATQMLSDFPDLDAALLTVDDAPAGRRTAEASPLSLTYGDQQIILLGTPEPVGDDLTEIAAYSRLWPDQTPAPADYAAHTIVSVLRPGRETTHVEGLADAALLSKVIAAAVGLSETVVAVYFGSANHVILPPLFRDLAIETLPEPMLPAWVALNVAPRPDGVMTGHTRGLDMLGLPDVEIVQSHESAEDTFGRIINTAIYLLENGPVIGDGDTLGATETAEIVAHHAPSQVDADKTVLSLEFVGEEFPEWEAPESEPQPKKRRWFGRK